MQAMQAPENLTVEQAFAKAQEMFHAGQLSQSEGICRKIIEAQPDYHPAYFQLGLIAAQVGKMGVAANMIGQAIHIDHNMFQYHRAVCEVFRRLGQVDKAIHHGRQAIELAPEDSESYYNLGIALNDGGQFEEAVRSYEQALRLNPNHGLSANNLGSCYEKIGDEDKAVEAYRKSIAVNPKHAEAQNNLGAILSARGELEEAKACFAAAIEGNPHFIHAHYNLSSLKKYTDDDPHLAILEGLLAQAEQMHGDSRIRFWFAIGKAWEDTKKYDQAFNAYQRGNTLKRNTFDYDVAVTENIGKEIIAKFDENFAQKTFKACDDPTPVFIVGMPRSGTTLIEQILSSHSQVYGAGELQDFNQALLDLQNHSDDQDSGRYMDWLLASDDALLKELGEAYIQRLRSHSKDAKRISDKMPGNVFYVGLIHKALPNAKIIHSMRDPIDICVSNYSRLFNESMPFAYDLEELGRYCKTCDALMAHWKAVLPEGTILDMRYEDNVADLETQARKLIHFCDLDWEDECLDFHKNKRHVKTASISQVRQPIYKSSVERWKRYENYLQPLIKVVNENE